jgi:uncharacterized protein
MRVVMKAWVRTALRELEAGLASIYAERLRGVYLYGSYARGEADAESDVDVLIVLDRVDRYAAEVDRTSALISELSLKYDRSISRVFVSWDDWSGRETPFLGNARRDAVSA